ncbi:MAG: hypothetical protein WCK53_05070 [Methanomicrobiales archaeon]
MKQILDVEEEAVEAYELATGFVGLGRFFEERRIWNIIRRGASCPAQK